MDAATRRQLENNTLPFGEMPRELQEALLIAFYLDVLPTEQYIQSADKFVLHVGMLYPERVYRLAPEPVIYPDYPWDLFDDEIQWMAIDESGELAMAENKMEQSVGNGNAYWFLASCRVRNIKFNRGNVAWQDSQMKRPKK